jgi:DNA-binding response OmpR family regulator
MATGLNIVVVEDHDALREVIVEALRLAGHTTIGVESAEELTERLEIHNIDLMVLDLNLPGEDGISLGRRIRLADPDIGIIMLTARSQLAEKVKGYESGADIYLTKPASLDELCAAINSLQRRIGKTVNAKLWLNISHCSLQGTDVKIELTQRETLILSTFLRMPNQQMETWQLMELLYQGEDDFNKASLEVQIARLRKKLLQAGAISHPIKSLRKVGYQLATSVKICGRINER